VELVEAALAVIDNRDGPLAAVVEVHPDEARAAAEAADADRRAGRWHGALHGIPVTVKDVIDVAGFHTRAGSAAYARRADRDAEAVRRLRAAGAVVVAKVSTHEFALGVTTPQSRNPHDATRIPGGSSGGSAISVATGMALASLGTDTRASIRVPAALSGVVGLKATFGAVPCSGIVSLSWTMDHVAPIAASVGDAALVLDVLLGGGTGLPDSPPGPGLRIGVPEACFANAQPGVAAAVRTALEQLTSRFGAEVQTVAEPSGASLDWAGAAGLVVSRCEAAAAHRSLGLDRSLYTAEVADQLEAADAISATDYLDAQRARSQLAERLGAVFAVVDVLAMPTAPVVAPRVEDCGRHLVTLARNAIPWSFVGFPALSVPVGTVGGLPVGLQLVAPPHREGLLVAAGLAVEAVVGRLPAPCSPEPALR
ncbi:MAG: amidase, partial [Acidimicrobiales bacterium]